MTAAPLDLQAERFTATGNITSEGMRNQLGRPRLDRLAVLVRESAQNAWDAQDPDQATVGFGVACYEMSPENVESLAQRVMHELPDPASVSDGDPSLRSLIEEARGRIQEGASSGLRGLAIYDRGTTGLGGPTRADVHDDGDSARDFIDFLRNVGQPPDKDRGGGTFGYGKAALYLSSAVSTILVHTRCVRLGEVESRFMGSCLTAHYQTREARFTGRHWWGRWDDERRVVDPILGDEADEIAAALGMPECPAGDLGTTILLLAPELGDRTPQQAMNYIAAQMLWNFWPKMVAWKERASAMHFEASLDGRPVPIPQPESTPPIDGFVQALRAVRAADSGEPSTSTARVSALQCHSPKRRLGQLALSRTIRRPRLETDFGEDPILPPFAHRCHHVALLRRAELVVAYHPGPPFPNDHLEYAGVFLADDSLDRTYANSEPPTHDEWRPENLADGRLRRLVGSTFRRIDEATAQFVKPAATSFETVADRPLAAVASYLGALLVGTEGPRGASAWGPVPGSGSSAGGSSSGAGPQHDGSNEGGSRPSQDAAPSSDEGQGSTVDGPNPAVERRSSSKRPRIDLSPDVDLQLRDGGVHRVFRFRLRIPAGTPGARVEARAYPILRGGVRENEPPAGAETPAIAARMDPDGKQLGSGGAIEIATAREGDYSIWIAGAPDALVGLELRAEGIDA